MKDLHHEPSSAGLDDMVAAARVADEQAEKSEDPADCSRAVAAWLSVVDLIPADVAPSTRADLLSAAAGALLRRHRLTAGPAEDLDVARRSLLQAVAAVGQDEPERAFYVSNLGVIYQEQHAVHHDPALLDLAVDCFVTAIEMAPEDDLSLPMYLSNLGSALADRYFARQADEDLRRAIAAAQRAVSLTPRRSPDWPAYVDNLGGALMQRYEAEGTMADLDAAVTAFRAAARGQRGTDERATTLANLADALRVRASRTARRADIRSALAAARRAVRFTSPAPPHRAARLAGLADVLRERYLRNGRLGTLDEAINTYRRVLVLADESREVPGHQNNLANCLRDRHAASGSRSDLEEAIALSRQAVAKAGLVTADTTALYLSNLGSTLRARYLLDGDEDDISQAVAAHRQSVELTTGRGPARSTRLNNLGNALHDHYARTGELSELEESIGAYRQAESALPDDAADRWRFRGNLDPVFAHGVRCGLGGDGLVAGLFAVLSAVWGICCLVAG